MTNVTCGLTAKKPGSAPCPIDCNRVWDYCTFFSYLWCCVDNNCGSWGCKTLWHL